MKCDTCGREREDYQLIHIVPESLVCRNTSDCYWYRTWGRFEDQAQELMGILIESGLFHAQCAEDKDHPCVVVWSSGAQGQIAAWLREGTQTNPTPQGPVLLEWGEPRPACDSNGNPVDAHITLRATPQDCANLQRAAYRQVGRLKDGGDEKRLLDEFVVVHWAKAVQQKG